MPSRSHQQRSQHRHSQRRRKGPPKPLHAPRRGKRGKPRVTPVDADWTLHIRQTPALVAAVGVGEGREPCIDDFPWWSQPHLRQAWRADSTGLAHDDATAAIREALASGEAKITKHREGLSPDPRSVSGATEWTVTREGDTAVWEAVWEVAIWPGFEFDSAVGIRACRRYRVSYPGGAAGGAA